MESNNRELKVTPTDFKKICTFIPMKGKIHFLAILLFFATTPDKMQAQKLQIISEYVAFQLYPDTTVMASGMFVFKNSATLQSQYPIFYPVQKDDVMGDVLEYKVKGDVELVQLTNEGIAFNYKIAPDVINHFWLTYKQKMMTDTATYFFSSSGYWQNALKEFQFTLILPENWDLLESTFSYDETWTDLGKTYYRTIRNNYNPPDIFTVVYRRPPPIYFGH